MSKAEDALFGTIARWQGDRPWGRVLDAGTGEHSLRWIDGLPHAGWVAVTGSASREAEMRKAVKPGPRGRVITGNWEDPLLLHGQVFDTVLADYLLGAMDGFAPYFQDRLFTRLCPHVGGRLYVVGLDPIPDQADTAGGRAIIEINRLRDAMILLAGHRCYREYPMEWVLRHLEGAGFVVEEATRIGIVYRARYVDGQLDVCASKLPYLADRGLARILKLHIEELRGRAKGLVETERGIALGSDYVVAARPS